MLTWSKNRHTCFLIIINCLRVASDLKQTQCAVGAPLGGVQQAMCISSFQKTALKVVQEPRTELGGPEARRGHLEQTPAQSAPEGGFERPRLEAGPMLEIADRKALVEPQRIQHEFERQFALGDSAAQPHGTGAGQARGGLEPLQILARLARLFASDDVLGRSEGEFAMRARADTHVVAERPVVQIVT